MPSIRFGDFVEEVLALYSPPFRRKATWFKMRTVLHEFAELRNAQGIPKIKKTSDLTPGAILMWLAEHADRAPLTNLSYLRTLRPACHYAETMGYLRVSPWKIRRDWVTFDALDDCPPVASRHLSIMEIGRFLDRLDAMAISGGWRENRLKVLGYLFCHTGLRKMEALGLRCDDVLLDKGVITIQSSRKRRLKTRSSRRLVGIPEDLGVVLEPWIDQVGSEWLIPGIRRTGPWFHGAPGWSPLDRIKAVAKEAGVPHATIHAFRRSLATHARRFGITKDDVKEVLGHTSTQIQDTWYVEEDVENARWLAQQIRFRPRPLPPREKSA